MAATGTRFWQHALRWPRRSRDQPIEDVSAKPVYPLQMPGISIGGFPLVRTVSQTAMSALHLATDLSTGMPVAIKTIRFEGSELTRQRFLRESEAAARLHHPDIVTTFAAGVEGEGPQTLGWIAMEWVSGSDLSRYTQASRLLPEPVALEVSARVAEALAYAHSMGVLHRDLKPANVLLNISTGAVKISDFGCAHLTDAERSRSGLLIGTPVYMAPEQLTGSPVDGRCDLYALGVMLYQLLTGTLPFDRPTMGELLAAVASEAPPPLKVVRPDLPSLLSDILAKALAKQADHRHVDGTQLAREIRLMVPACASLRQFADADSSHNV